MARDFSKSKWPEIRELIKKKWDLLDEEDIDSLKGHLNELSDKIQENYFYSKERADFEMFEFKKKLNSKEKSNFSL